MPSSTVRTRRSRFLILKVILTAALVAAVLVFAISPNSPRPIASAPDSRTVRGAFHVHTTRSDGALDKVQVALAASRAGLQFAIFADHGDGTDPPDRPEYLNGVLCVDAAEVSTEDGHYIALGIGQAPYRLGGEGRAVAEDVARLGGFGIAAHPFSNRPDLAWSDWTARIDALEWLNADSEWRDEGRAAIARAITGYLWRPAGALATLLDRPVSALAKFDELASSRRVVTLAAHDAHGGLGAEPGHSGRGLQVPSYEATFRAFSNNVSLAAPLTGNPDEDQRLLLDAIRAGRVFTVIDAIASPGSLQFTATAGGMTTSVGGDLPPSAGPAQFTVRTQVPDGASTVLLHNGRAIAEQGSGSLDHTAASPGEYRVEVRVPGTPGSPPVPWLLSNPIFRLAKAEVAMARPEATLQVAGSDWRSEASPGSIASVEVAEGRATLAYVLKAGGEDSQFAALVTDLASPSDDAAALVFTARAARPSRISAQLRYGNDARNRWRRSFYVDQEEREVRISLADLRPADQSGPRPLIERATSLLFVVDLTNAVPGSQGTFTINPR